MEEITPELVAAIATRLFRESSQSTSAPVQGFDSSAEVASGMPTPVFPSLPTVPGTGNLPGIPGTSAIPTSLPSASSPAQNAGVLHGFRPGTAGLAVPGELPKGFSSTIPLVGVPQRETPPVVAPSSSTDGLRAFVERIRAGESLKGSSFCTGVPVAEQFRTNAARAATKTSYASRPLDVDAIRRDFPILQQSVHGKPLAWLDNAATTQKPQAVIDALVHFLRAR